jgi:hypothetical protein
VRAFSAGGAELIGRSITGVISSDVGSATVSPSSGISPLAVAVTGVTDGTDCTVAAASGAIAATPLEVTVAPAGVYGIISPDPILWLKAETESATPDGTYAPTWHDSSPGAWDMTPLTGGSHAAKWDAAKQALNFLSSDFAAYENAAFDALQAGITEYTLFVVSQERSNGGCVMSSLTGDFWEGYTAAGRYRTDLGSFGDSSYFSFADLLQHVHESRYDGSQATNVLRLVQAFDGALPAETQFGIPTSLTSGPGIVIGHGTGLTYFDGWLWELLWFPARLSDADCDMVRAAIGAKYGISVI